MTALYVESSAVLSWIFNEPGSDSLIKIMNKADICVSSVLTMLETERALLRAESAVLINSGDRLRLRGLFFEASSGWAFLEIYEEIRTRAARSFPVEPIRSLDAIHLSTALEFLQIYPDLRILTLDKRILANVVPLGLQSALP